MAAFWSQVQLNCQCFCFKFPVCRHLGSARLNTSNSCSMPLNAKEHLEVDSHQVFFFVFLPRQRCQVLSWVLKKTIWFTCTCTKCATSFYFCSVTAATDRLHMLCLSIIVCWEHPDIFYIAFICTYSSVFFFFLRAVFLLIIVPFVRFCFATATYVVPCYDCV